MKKFAFSLQVLLKFKLSLEKEQKAKLAEIQQLLEKLMAERNALAAKQNAELVAYGEESQKGTTRDRLQTHVRFLDHLRDAITEQDRRIAEARHEKAKRQAVLLRTMKEIKALHKLRDAQYQEYLAEVAREEEKIIGDIVSFKVTTGDRAAM